MAGLNLFSQPFLILQFAVSAVWDRSTDERLCKDPVKHHTADRVEKRYDNR